MREKLLFQFLRYIGKVYHFDRITSQMKDRRKNPEIPPQHVFLSVFLMFLMRQPSLNRLEPKLKTRRFKHLIGSKRPQVASADAISYSLDRFQHNPLWDGLVGVNKTFKRNKVFSRGDGGVVAAGVDGVELFKSKSRCCPECLTRTVREKQPDGTTSKVTEYYHRAVEAQVLGAFPHALLGSQLQRPGEDEVACASRVIEKIVEEYGPRFVNLWVVDAAYAEAPFLHSAKAHRAGVLVVFKDERREVLRDAQGLFDCFPPNLEGSEDQGHVEYKIWDEESFDTWESLGEPIRMVKVEEIHHKVRIRGGSSQSFREYHRWWAGSTVPKDKLSSCAVRRLLHRRWEVENNGHRELKTSYHADHPFRHNPNAILALLLILALVCNLFYAFLFRNLKSFRTQDVTASYVAEQLTAEILTLESPQYLLFSLWEGG